LCCSNPWATLTGSSASVAASLSPTAELDPLLNHLTTTLGFLSRALASAPLRRIARSVLGTISSVIWDNVLSRHRFSTAGAAQLQADLAAICRVVDAAAGSGVAEAGLRKCLEGAQLVGLPVKGGKSQTDAQSSTAEDGGEDWEAWGGEVAETAEVESSGDTRTGNEELGLWEVEKRLFADNQSAREVLEDLNMEMLSETEARAVLGRRVELAG
jgi:hypothetical protein